MAYNDQKYTGDILQDVDEYFHSLPNSYEKKIYKVLADGSIYRYNGGNVTWIKSTNCTNFEKTHAVVYDYETSNIISAYGISFMLKALEFIDNRTQKKLNSFDMDEFTIIYNCTDTKNEKINKVFMYITDYIDNFNQNQTNQTNHMEIEEQERYVVDIETKQSNEEQEGYVVDIDETTKQSNILTDIDTDFVLQAVN